jgi:drug/metabolite transporter (DMT)-like permease
LYFGATQWGTSFAGLVLVTYSFMFAMKAYINQGCVTALFNLATLYTTFVFYLKFNEKISPSKFVGLAMMLVCVSFLAIESTYEVESETTVAVDGEGETTVAELQLTSGLRFKYGMLAIFFACAAPLFWTVKAYYIRLADSRYKYSAIDVTIDSMFLQGFIYVGILCFYLTFVGEMDHDLFV